MRSTGATSSSTSRPTGWPRRCTARRSPASCATRRRRQRWYRRTPDVTLVDLRSGPITTVTPTGIQTERGFHELDAIVYATGFDAMTGALTRIDVPGRDGLSLKDFWADEGPMSYLGLAVAGFPNLFTIQGPGSPSAATNFVAALEQHVEWIEHATALVAPAVLVHPSCNSWYNGGNMPGKKRMYMGYTAGIPEYRRRCDEIAANGYAGFKLG
jgi:hypothetical protein